MEHERVFEGVQAGHALNAGKLLLQYLLSAPALPQGERFEATLTICTLHSLLTQCAELLKYREIRALSDLRMPVKEVPNLLGLTASMVEENTFPEVLTGSGLLEHLRDALSHPAPDEHFYFRPTGFTTTGSEDGIIRGYTFTNSPWIKQDQRCPFGLSLPCSTERAAHAVISKFARGKRKDFPLDVLPLENGRFDVGYKGQPYVPLLVVTLPLQTLIDVTLGLAQGLSQQALPANR